MALTCAGASAAAVLAACSAVAWDMLVSFLAGWGLAGSVGVVRGAPANLAGPDAELLSDDTQAGGHRIERLAVRSFLRSKYDS